jgi:hypothetical protein
MLTAMKCFNVPLAMCSHDEQARTIVEGSLGRRFDDGFVSHLYRDFDTAVDERRKPPVPRGHPDASLTPCQSVRKMKELLDAGAPMPPLTAC